MKVIEIAALGALLLFGAGCREGAKTPPPADTTPAAVAAPILDVRIAKARSALGPLKKNLKQALMSAVADKGAVGAIDVCRIEAPKLAKSASTDGLRVGRSALKLRNPKNAAEPWLAPALEALSKAPPSEGLHQTVDLPDGSLGYVEPIYTGGLCLTCHGATLAPEVASAIDAAYPQDQARGFAADEFRGVFWAVVP